MKNTDFFLLRTAFKFWLTQGLLCVYSSNCFDQMKQSIHKEKERGDGSDQVVEMRARIKKDVPVGTLDTAL